ncbi:evolutionarily conserved signaling intermediate in Toll pathway, mitochondrial [Anabrus simplex]|uniref:evolutionarily conserved signaling intermediate in Toll pathway, mitochondrial n=1 Tax=Anabrus simplex TaxID=316456 RepID=UPI0035A280C8
MLRRLSQNSFLKCLRLSRTYSQCSLCSTMFIGSMLRPVFKKRIGYFHTNTQLNKNEKEDPKRDQALVTQDFFSNVKDKSKETYLSMINIFIERDVHRRGHVEFIYAALRHMKEFNVHKDLEAYKSLIDILPKGKFIPTNIFQAEFMHYPKQQQCIIDLLEQMEDNGVCPDFEMEDLLVNIFGRRGHPVRKYWRMMYWMPKFKNLSPWPLPNPVPADAFELAKLALERMSSVDLQSKVTVYQTADIADSLDKTWIVSAQSPVQQNLLETHPRDAPLYVEGAFRIWLRNESVHYFILRADPRPRPQPPPVDIDDVSNIKIPLQNEPESEMALPPSVHEQDDGIIVAMCATGTSSRDSLLSWIRLLERNDNPSLAQIPVLFTLKSPLGEVIPIDESSTQTNEETVKNITD